VHIKARIESNHDRNSGAVVMSYKHVPFDNFSLESTGFSSLVLLLVHYPYEYVMTKINLVDVADILLEEGDQIKACPILISVLI
jgi:hypothetical protein